MPSLSRLLLAAFVSLLLAPALSAQPLANAPVPGDRQRASFNANWRYIEDDPVNPAGHNDATDPESYFARMSYPQMRDLLMASTTGGGLVVRADPASTFGSDISYTRPDFNDSAWRQLNLPHDWGIEGNFSMNLPGTTGRLPWAGVGWYRKNFAVPAAAAGKLVFLDMDGAMAYANIWVNGHYAGGWPYGYASFRVDLTPFIKVGENNVIAIRLFDPPNSSRWYPGGGIYRNTWLEYTNPVHLAHWGTYITTPEITADKATVDLKIGVDNHSSADVANVTVTTQIFALNTNGQRVGAPVATASSSALSLAAGAHQQTEISLNVASPKLWGLKTPNLYSAVTTVLQNGQAVDATESTFGIRTIKFDPNEGFFLNGEHVKIFGVCDHHDLGPLGTAVNYRALQRQIEILQEMGCNAIRTSHNPPAPELLDLCDRMGMLVMDETFDCWDRQKVANDYHLLFADWHEKDARMLVRRDRNHPSVILWSVGNEIPDQGSAIGNQIALELTRIVHEEDPTRFTTTANNNAGFTGLPANEYIYGFNYKPDSATQSRYSIYHTANPDANTIATETASTISSRGVYVFPVSNNKSGGGTPDHQMSSYDLYAPSWATPPDAEFASQDKYPFMSGEFVWTGFDYLGEPTNNTRGGVDQSRSSYFGIVDLDGFKKDRFYIYQAHWRPELPMAHILPHWNWPDRVGQITPVHVYTSGDEAELFLNGVSLGRKKKIDPDTGAPAYRIRWDDVVYQPGELKVVAYKNGQKWAEDTVKTTGPATAVTLTPDHSTIAADGQDLSFVTVAVKDKDGLTVPVADNALHYEISGPGEIVAVDNGDATSLAPMQGTKDSKAFNGLALVIVRGQPGQAGTVTLTATSAGLAAATTTIKTNAQ